MGEPFGVPEIPVHIALELVGLLLAIVPLFAVARAYRQTPSMRLGLVLIAFLVLEVRIAAIVAIHTVLPVSHFTEEMIDFGGDLSVIVAFACAFLYGIRWTDERKHVDVA